MSFATVGSRGKPHVIGIAFVKVRDGKLVITNNYMSSTVKNITKNPSVSIAVWDKKWNGFRIDGKAKQYTSGKWYEAIKRIKENKGEPCSGAIVVTPTKITKLA